MDSCDSTGRSSICGGRQKMILAQLADGFQVRIHTGQLLFLRWKCDMCFL